MSGDVLEPHELAARGYGPDVFGPPKDTTEEVQLMNFNRSVQGEYTPAEDRTETLPDGRQIQVAVAGAPMPMSEAVKAGLVGPDGQPVPAPREDEAEAERADAEREAKEDKEDKAAKDAGPPKPSETKPQQGPSERK